MSRILAFGTTLGVMLALMLAGTASAYTGLPDTAWPGMEQLKDQFRMQTDQFQAQGWLEAKGTHFEHKAGNLNIMQANTLVINDTGGDCTPEKMGTWDETTRTCTLDRDLFETVQIDSNDTTLNGSGYNITGSGSGYGVFVSGRTGVTIKNLNVNNFTEGILLDSSNDNTLSNNNASNNQDDGIFLVGSSNNTISNNIVSNNYNYFGIYLSDSSNNTISNNNASNNFEAGIFLVFSSNNMISGNIASNNGPAGYDPFYSGIVMIVASNSNTLTDNTVSNNGFAGINVGLFYDPTAPGADNNILSGNTVSENGVAGILQFNSSNNTISNNNVSNHSEIGISLGYLPDSPGGNNNTLSGNNVSNNYGGIILFYANDSTLISNTASNGYGGIGVFSSSNNTLSNNTASNNSFVGIELQYSNNNMLNGNNASNNLLIEELGTSGIAVLSSSNNTLNDNDVINNYIGMNLENSGNNVLNSNNVSNNACGICIFLSIDGLIINNIVMNNWDGIYMPDSNNNAISGNSILNNSLNGIYIGYSPNNTISNNNISYNNQEQSFENAGLNLWFSDNNSIQGNYISNNPINGVLVESSNNNTLNGNTASNNLDSGISLANSNDNTIYNNYFDNPNNAVDNGINTWNITKTEGTNIIGGPYLGGNFWSDYTGVDTDGDGLGDTLIPYNSSGNITNGGDFLPLIIPTKPTVGNISGFKINNGTNTGISGWNITLSNSTMQESMLTLSDGSYKFTNLVNGDYTVTEETRPDFTNVSPAQVQVTVNGNDVTGVNFTNQPVPSTFKVTKDFRDGVVNFRTGQLGTLLPQNGSNYNVSYVLNRKGRVSSISPREVYGVITVNGTGVANVTVDDTFSAASGAIQLVVSPARLVGGVEIIRYSTTTGVATAITRTTQITSASVDNTAHTVDLAIQLNTPLASDEKLMVYIKFASALRNKLPNYADFVNTAIVETNLSTPETVAATINFV